mmetsp:Transcript_27760/g.58185  ORF Transcript_27760/g.58185 Transcript_27760/m.58185 type:complete len:242 (+) Transcript_27760:892-1617(+)
MPPLGILARLFVAITRFAGQFLPLGFFLLETNGLATRQGVRLLFLALELLLRGGGRGRHRFVHVGKARSHLGHSGQRDQVQAQLLRAGSTAAADDGCGGAVVDVVFHQFPQSHVCRNGNRVARKGSGGHVVHAVEPDIAGAFVVLFHHAVAGVYSNRFRSRRVRPLLEGVLNQLDLLCEFRRQKDGDLPDNFVVVVVVVIHTIAASRGSKISAGNRIRNNHFLIAVAGNIHGFYCFRSHHD